MAADTQVKRWTPRKISDHPDRVVGEELFDLRVFSVATVTDGISGVNGSLGLAGKGARFLRGSILFCPQKVRKWQKSDPETVPL